MQQRCLGVVQAADGLRSRGGALEAAGSRGCAGRVLGRAARAGARFDRRTPAGLHRSGVGVNNSVTIADNARFAWNHQDAAPKVYAWFERRVSGQPAAAAAAAADKDKAPDALDSPFAAAVDALTNLFPGWEPGVHAARNPLE